MIKNKKLWVVLIVLIVIILVIGLICWINISSKKRISNNIVEYIKESISTNVTKKYIDENISKVTKEAATEMIRLYEQYQDNNIERLYNEFKIKILEYNGNYDINSLNNIENITDVDLKDILTEIRNNGYRFKQIWGDIIIVKDYSQYKDYSEYVTEDMQKYIDIQNKYENQLYSYQDINNLLNIIIETERSINSIKEEKIKNNASKIYAKMLLLIIEGDDIYVPKVYGEENNKILIETMQTYINSNPNTVTSEILNKYISAITADNYEYRENTIALKEEISNNISNYFNK